MQQTKWFDRKFDFNEKDNIFPFIIERLRGTPARLNEKVVGLAEDILIRKINNHGRSKKISVI